MPKFKLDKIIITYEVPEEVKANNDLWDMLSSEILSNKSFGVEDLSDDERDNLWYLTIDASKLKIADMKSLFVALEDVANRIIASFK
jgi:hypothetical protein